MKLVGYLSILLCSILGGWLAHGFFKSDPKPTTAPTSPVASSQQPPVDFRTERLEICKSLAKILVTADSETIHDQAIQLLKTYPGDEKIWNALFLRWFQIDSVSAWSFASEEVDQKDHPNIITSAISQWASLDPQAASAALTNPTRSQLIKLLKKTMVSDPEFTFALLDHATTLLGFEFDAKTALPWENWVFDNAQSNPAKLDSWLRKHDRTDLLGAYLAGLATTDRAAAHAWLGKQENQESLLTQLGNFVGFEDRYSPDLVDFASEAIPTGNRRLVVLDYALQRLATKDPDLAVSETQRLFADPSQQAEILAKIAEDLRRHNFYKAWEIVQLIDPTIIDLARVEIPEAELTQNGDTEKHHKPFNYQWDLTRMRGIINPADLRSEMLADLLVVDRQAAIDYLFALPADQVLSVAGHELLGQWTSYEPEAALTWFAKSLPDDVDFSELEYIVEESYISPDLARTYLKKLPKGKFRQSLVDLIGQEMGGEPPESVVQFLRNEGGSELELRFAYGDWASERPQPSTQGPRGRSRGRSGFLEFSHCRNLPEKTG